MMYVVPLLSYRMVENNAREKDYEKLMEKEEPLMLTGSRPTKLVENGGIFPELGERSL